jgi:hypothetical protein
MGGWRIDHSRGCFPVPAFSGTEGCLLFCAVPVPGQHNDERIRPSLNNGQSRSVEENKSFQSRKFEETLHQHRAECDCGIRLLFPHNIGSTRKNSDT